MGYGVIPHRVLSREYFPEGYFTYRRFPNTTFTKVVKVTGLPR